MTARRRTVGRKRKSRLRRKLERWAWRRVSTWAADKRAKIRKAVAPRVVIASAAQRAWERQFPNVNAPQRLEMRKVEEWMAEFEAVFANGWRVEFAVSIYDHKTLREEAYDFAVLAHGEIMRSVELIEITPVNELANDLLDGKIK